MKRIISKIEMGQKKIIEIIIIEGDESSGPNEGYLGFKDLWDFISSIQANTSILRHSVDCPEEFIIKYNGKAWTIESRTTVQT